MGYNLGALFPFTSRHFFKQNQLNVLSIYKVVFGLERAFFLDVGSAVNH